MSDSVRPHRRQPTRLRHPWDSPGKNTGVGCHFLLQCMKVKSQSEVAQSCQTGSDPMDCNPPGSSIHGIFQARVLEWGAIAFSVWQDSQLYYQKKLRSNVWHLTFFLCLCLAWIKNPGLKYKVLVQLWGNVLLLSMWISTTFLETICQTYIENVKP